MDVDKSLRKAERHVKLGEVLQAKKIYQNILSQFPKNKKAIQGYRKINTLPQAEVEKLIGLFNNNHLKETVSLGTVLKGQFPNEIILYEILGAANMRLGIAGETIKNYRKLLQLKPEHTDAYNNLGIVFYEQGKYLEAAKNYQKAIDINPDLADLHYNLGNTLKQSGNLKKAIESYEASLVINPDDPEVLNAFGNALREYGEFDQAIENYAKALTIRPDFAEAFACLGAKELEKGNWSEGIVAYNKSLAIHKENSNTNLFLFLSRLKHIDDLIVFEEVSSKIAEVVLLEVLDIQFIQNTGHFLTSIIFPNDSSKEQRDILFEFWAVPWINRTYDSNNINLAMYLEHGVYSLYTKTIETEEHFFKSMSVIRDPAVRAGRRYRQNLPFKSQNQAKKIRKIGFFIHNAGMLAHIEVLLTFLKSSNKQTMPDFKPFIFCFNGYHQEMFKNFAEVNAEVIRLDINASGQCINSHLDRMLRFRDLCHSMDIHTVVWVSLVVQMAFTFSMRIAPHQVWWSMKWANYFTPDIDKYMSTFSFKRKEVLHNQEFLSGRMQFSNLLSLDSKAEASKIRSSYDSIFENLGHSNSRKVILGTMGRAEKLKDPSFLNSVSEILKNNPNAIFMWTGQSEDSFIKSTFEQAGVGKQVEFIGWVDTKVFAHVFDIHLDSFPFGNGITALHSMAAGTPVVLHQSKMVGCTNWDNMIGPLFNDNSIDEDYRKRALNIFFNTDIQENVYLAAADEKAYVDMVQRLIADEDYRCLVGDAYCEFANEMMSDPNETSQIFTKHLLQEN